MTSTAMRTTATATAAASATAPAATRTTATAAATTTGRAATTGHAAMGCYGVGTATAGHATTPADLCRRSSACTSATRRGSARTGIPPTAAADIPASTTAAEAMPAPAVAIAPVGPRTHPQEDTVIKIARPVETVGRAGIRSIVVISPRANRLNTDADENLCVCCWS